VRFEFPQIKGLADEKRLQNINFILENTAFYGPFNCGGPEYIQEYNDAGTEVKNTYEIKFKAPELLSIYYSGYLNNMNAAHPIGVGGAININIKSGEVIRLDDFLRIDRELLSYNDGDLTPTNYNHAAHPQFHTLRNALNYDSSECDAEEYTDDEVEKIDNRLIDWLKREQEWEALGTWYITADKKIQLSNNDEHYLGLMRIPLTAIADHIKPPYRQIFINTD
jgi:hypothetical protein